MNDFGFRVKNLRLENLSMDDITQFKGYNGLFAERLKELRKAASLNQTELANKLKISRGCVSYYEKGERLPNIETIYEIAHFFNASADYLVGLSDAATTDTSIKAICD